MERLTPEDAAFLHLEDRVSAMHSVTIAVFDGPAPSFDRFRDRMSDRIHLVPRFRQRVLEMPMRLERPAWVDSPEFDIEFHVRHTGIPEPTHQSLSNLVERIMSQRLDRGKPLWELWMVSGLADGHWGVISKAHHAMVDGVSGIDPLTLIVDTFRRSRGPAQKPWEPEPIPSSIELAAGSVASLAFNPVEQYRWARRATRPVRGLLNQAAIARSPNRSLVGAVGPHRRWRSADIELELLRHIRAAHNASTNDVVLALICRGFQTMFVDSGQPAPTRIRTVVPFAVGQSGVFTNLIASQTVDLPTNADSFAKMVHRIAAQTTGPHNATAIGGTALRGLDGLAAPTLAALGLRQATRTGLRAGNVDTAIINAPGPSQPVTLLGADMNWIVPAIPLVAKVRIGVGVMSYRDKIVIGITGDRDAQLEIEALALSIDHADHSLADL